VRKSETPEKADVQERKHLNREVEVGETAGALVPRRGFVSPGHRRTAWCLRSCYNIR
jgi:hypothetical protein